MANAQGDKLAGATFLACKSRQRLQPLYDFGRAIPLDPGHNHHKLVSSHAGGVIVFTARFLELGRESLQEFVAQQVSQAVVNVFEAVEVCDENRKFRIATLATRDFTIEMQKQ